MKKTDVLLKNVDEGIFRLFKAEAVKEGANIGEAAEKAFAQWIKSRKLQKVKERDRMKRAIEHMDTARTTSGRWSAAKEIRRWRDSRK